MSMPMVEGALVIGIMMARDNIDEVRISTRELMEYDECLETRHDDATDEFVIRRLPPIKEPEPIKKE